MAVKICPRCNTRYSVQDVTQDFVHDCRSSASEALRNEDVVVVGSFEDYSGSGTRFPPMVMMQGSDNKFQGTRAGVEGEDFVKVSSRGANVKTHSTRFHLEYIPEVNR